MMWFHFLYFAGNTSGNLTRPNEKKYQWTQSITDWQDVSVLNYFLVAANKLAADTVEEYVLMISFLIVTIAQSLKGDALSSRIYLKVLSTRRFQRNLFANETSNSRSKQGS